jgi:hypothetical protein
MHTRHTTRTLGALLAAILIGIAALPGGAAPARAPRPAAFDPVARPSAPGYLWFAGTGHTLAGPFRAYWEGHGGLAQFGYPISEPFSETLADGHPYMVQYFERNRFELHPEIAGPASGVLLGLLGSELTHGGAPFPRSAPFGPSAHDRYFAATGHGLHGAFLAYWQAHGGLPVYGYPISDEILEQNPADGRVYLVQYFERNRLELHPRANAPAQVQLGLLGVELLRTRGWLR